MRQFRFRLESVLRLRQSQTREAEEAVRKSVAHVQLLVAEIQATICERERLKSELCSHRHVTGLELSWATSYADSLAALHRRLLAELKAAREELARNRERFLEVKRKLQLLERLRERRHGEWQVAETHHWESLASDSYLAGWGRKEGVD